MSSTREYKKAIKKGDLLAAASTGRPWVYRFKCQAIAAMIADRPRNWVRVDVNK